MKQVTPRGSTAAAVRGAGHRGPAAGQIGSAGTVTYQARDVVEDLFRMPTWTEWDDAVRGFPEIDLVGHEGDTSRGDFCFTLTITDISTGWTETRSVRGIDSDDRSKSINWKLLRWREQENLTFPPVLVSMANRNCPWMASRIAR